jgi:hypothetical protein
VTSPPLVCIIIIDFKGVDTVKEVLISKWMATEDGFGEEETGVQDLTLSNLKRLGLIQSSPLFKFPLLMTTLSTRSSDYEAFHYT